MLNLDWRRLKDVWAVKNARKIGSAATLLIFSTFVSSIAPRAQPVDRDVQIITPFFAAPIPSQETPKGERAHPVLADLLRSSTEPAILLAVDSGRASLLLGANQTGFGSLVPLHVQGYSLHLLGGSGDTLWIGGYSKPYRLATGGRRTFAYLAKIDRLGHLLWEREFGGQTERRIQSMASLPSGDIVVSATDSQRTWLAKISSDGNLVWERDVGLGKGSAIATVGDVIALAAVEASSDNQGYREDVSVWSFDQTGKQLHHWVIREGINRIAWEYTEDIQIEQSGDSLYIISKWGTFAPIKPFEVARFDLRAGLIWRKELPETVSGDGVRAHICTLAITALSTGDLLIACRSKVDEITLLRLSAASGGLTKSLFHFSALPTNCDDPWSPASLMIEKSQEAVWLFGSPRSSDEKPCGWIGQAALRNWQSP